MFIYLHGLNSSGRSHKAQWLAEHLAPVSLWAPTYAAYDADRAMGQLCPMVEQAIAANSPVVLVGSSLGGFYGLVLSARFELPLVLINPAILPRNQLSRFAGPQHNESTGEHYELTSQHLEALERYRLPVAPRGQRMLLLQDEGDEVIDGHYAREFLADVAELHLFDGGSHSFEHLTDVLPLVMELHQEAAHLIDKR